jgi:hypothetical protein
MDQEGRVKVFELAKDRLILTVLAENEYQAVKLALEQIEKIECKESERETGSTIRSIQIILGNTFKTLEEKKSVFDYVIQVQDPQVITVTELPNLDWITESLIKRGKK